ncbi:MAG: DUF547 domain-containing protein [Candidatus Omnitrophica bacterium]|nr:DUF547 domain-containing protein [Candidatus Omnitrophota bacterium]
MRVFRSLFYFVVFQFIVSSFSPLRAARVLFDHSTWDQFLKKYVNEKGEMDFKSAKADLSLLEDYEKQLAHLPSSEEGNSWPREEMIAIYLNAYHVGVVRGILSVYPVPSIQQIPGFWENHFIQIVDEYLSLDQIRRDLIATVKDEKIHLALWTGAKSSPRLRQEAFTGPQVEGQLFLAAREFVKSPQFVQIDPAKNKIILSRIFKWYGEDFELDFATVEDQGEFTRTEFAVLSFLAHYLEEGEKINFLEEGRYKIKYNDYDWSLNEWIQEKSQNSASPASN